MNTDKLITDDFKIVTEDLYRLYKKKNADYGDSFSKSCDTLGIVASIVRMSDKINRLQNIYNKDPKIEQESIQDTVTDLANYAIMTLMWLNSKHVYEICPYCDSQVILENKFEVQQCKVCGKLIKPCSICNNNTCNDCLI